MERIIFKFGNSYECRYFFDIDAQHEGVEVSCCGELLGSIVGLSIPDKEDKEACDYFDNEVINWIIDNEN